MNLPSTQRLTKSPRRWRAVRAFTAFALITFLVTAPAVQAEPVRINQVVQTLSSYQGPAELKLSQVTQDRTSGTKTTNPADGPANDTPGDTAKVDGLLPGLPMLQDPQQLGVEVIEEAEVEGTICDCGEILIPGGGFPKWPLLFLTAVPLIFINDCETCNDTPTSTPTPTPPSPPFNQTTPTPEPASLLLFGTGLLAVGAGLRRRYTKMKLAEHAKAAREEE
ncbi:MAG TPA: PEP-CTERM sorting domain-containing protein [Pyrinomonadaceae bacterium]